ncbi:hypothetical protein SLS60_004219 [Paraconiothyrium brasiliense]|uniref:Uncharacterized protein n=1 Tax=Paraconiothyrium brasiliense TaxID=300254 RepID=A0ABR3RQV4_9PLEO
MWNHFRNGSSRSSSNASGPVVVARSDMSGVSVRSSNSSLKGHELKDMQELLDFHKSLVQSLGEDLHKRASELVKVKKLTANQEVQIDTQQAEVERLIDQNTDLKRRVAELKKQVHEGNSRIDELVKAINSSRNRDSQTDGVHSGSIPLDGIVKDALIEQLESDVERLTQDGLDHDRDVQALASTHQQMVNELNKQVSTLRGDLEHERYIIAKNMVDFIETTKLKEAAEEKLQQRIVRDALGSQGEYNSADAQSEQLKQAISYAEELRHSQRLFQDGKEVELFHLSNLCGLAQAQEKTIARLRAANVELLAANRQWKQEDKQIGSKVSTLASPSPEMSGGGHPKIPHRNVTGALPLRSDSTAEPTTPSKRSKLRKRDSIVNSLHDLGARTAPVPSTSPPDTPASPSTPSTPSKRHLLTHKLRHSFSLSKPAPRSEQSKIEQLHLQLAAAQQAATQHEHEKQALQSEVASLRLKVSENVEASQGLMVVTEEAALGTSSASDYGGYRGLGAAGIDEAANRLFQTYRAIRESGGTTDGERRPSAEEETEAYSYLFGEIPTLLEGMGPTNT